MALPSLREAEDRVWGWKDQLPLRELAWYGRFVRGRASLLAPDVLAALYPVARLDAELAGRNPASG